MAPSTEWISLGPAQLDLLLPELKSGQAAPSEQWVCYLDEAVNEHALRAAWETLLHHHAALRIGLDPSEPLPRCQWIEPHPELRWQFQNLDALSPLQQEAEWRGAVERERAAPFSLTEPPLFRLGLYRLSAAEYRLLLTYHPLLLDSVALSNLFADLRRLLAGETLPANAAAATAYREGREEQARRLRAQEQELATFWSEALAGLEAPPSVQLAPARAGAGSEPQLPRCVEYLDADGTRALRAAADSAYTPLEALLEAAWALLLGSYSGTKDVIFGVVPSRPDEVERPVGLFTAAYPLRLRLTRDECVAGFLRRVWEQSRAARSGEPAPLAAVHSWGGILPGRPLFETLLIREEVDAAAAMQRAFGRGRRFERLTRTTQPLQLTVSGTGTLRIELGFAPEHFERDAAAQMAEAFRELLLRLPHSLALPLEELSLLSASQAARLRDWNRTEAEFPAERLLHEWVEASADRCPDTAAVQGPGSLLTYAELDEQANRLAHRLRALGAGPDQFIALLLRRSARAVVALLAVLKSGAAYLPLDPDSPAGRLQFQLEDSRAGLVIVDAETRPLLRIEPGRLLCLDEETGDLARQPRARPARLAGPEHLCYGIYTSGSTGTPKLIGVEHRNTANLLAFATREVLAPEDVRYVPFTDSLSGDASVHQVFATLALGGTLVQLESSLEVDRSPFWERFTYFGTTPTLLASTLDRGGLPPAVRTVGLGAEAIPDELVARLASLPQVEKVFNFYGPTEATVYCTVDCVLDRQRGLGQDLSTAAANRATGSGRIIGRPLANTDVLVLDEWGLPAPLGVAGELFVGGAGVARGYPRLPEQTRERFRSDLPAGQPGRRYYRTGDLGRYRTDGRIEFLGRVDDQVKIRGYRVEPGEVAAVIQQVSGIRDAAVIACQDEGEMRLLAYYVPATAELRPEELRRAAARVLPAHLLPAAFVPLPALPLTPTGKLDRRALPPPSEQDRPGARVLEPARDELELRVTQLWRRALRRSQIGRRDIFFDLGGHSFLAVTLLAEVEREFGARLPLSLFAGVPTVEGMAAALRAGSVAPSWQSLVPLQPSGSRSPFFAVHGIGGGVLCFRELAQYLGPDQPFYGLQAVSLGGAEREYDRIEAMATHYLRELRSIQPTGPYRLGGLSFGGVVALEIARQLREAGEEIAALVLLDSRGPGYPRYPGWGRRLRAHARHFRALTASARVDYVQTRARSLADRARRQLLGAGYRSQRAAHLPQALSDLGIAHLAAAYHYQHCPYAGKITLLRTEQQPIGCLPDPSSGWAPLATGGLEVKTVPGDHVTFLHEPHVREVARTLAEVLSCALTAYPVTP